PISVAIATVIGPNPSTIRVPCPAPWWQWWEALHTPPAPTGAPGGWGRSRDLGRAPARHGGRGGGGAGAGRRSRRRRRDRRRRRPRGGPAGRAAPAPPPRRPRPRPR